MNDSAISLLEEIRRLMEIRGENVFKIRAFEKAQASLAEVQDLKDRATAGTLTEIPGIGKGIAEVLTEFLLKGTSKVRDDLQASLPEGLLELTAISGVGPKKAMQLIEELGIHSVAELEYACKENRLLKLKGFGDKIQHKILEGIAFQKNVAGQCRLSEAFELAEKLLPRLVEACGGEGAARVSETGALRRRMETLSALEFLIEETGAMNSKAGQRRLDQIVAEFRQSTGTSLALSLHYARPERFGYELARTTASPQHWKALGTPEAFDARTEEDFFEKLKLAFIPPEARETGEEVTMARKGGLSELLAWDGVRGVFHNHTTRSDGSATLEQMIVGAKKLGYEYIGISDHSQSAFYAQGLKQPELLAQEREVRELQDKHPEIRIFWGIESDILADGSLDYETGVLKKFDFVVASIHSRFKMEREAMTDRILTAIRNPATRFLGHATGRLLLGRKGYDVDMERVIEEAAKHDVAIEINANPQRLDIDWRWGPQLRQCRTPVSVNPDAHEVAGLEDTRYGIAMARKALLPTALVVNSRGADEVAKWLRRA
jgi:DNA polymerase (family 10)